MTFNLRSTHELSKILCNHHVHLCQLSLYHTVLRHNKNMHNQYDIEFTIIYLKTIRKYMYKTYQGFDWRRTKTVFKALMHVVFAFSLCFQLLSYMPYAMDSNL